MIWKVLVCIGIFIVGYFVGAREGTDAIKLGELERILLNFLAFGSGAGIAGVFGYGVYIYPFKRKIAKQRQRLEEAEDTLAHDKIKLDEEREERIKGIFLRQEETVKERCQEACREALARQRRQIEDEVEEKYRREMERLKGRSQSPAQEKKRTPKTLTAYGAPQFYRASDGKIYAKLRAGEPVGKS